MYSLVVHWKIYYALPTSILNGTIWDQIIPPGHSADLTNADQFFADLSAGELPDFSFVRPGVGYSTEAEEDIGEGDAWVGQLVDAVAHSKYWDSTAIFLTDISAPNPGRSLTINLEAETGGLSLDSSANGPVALTLTGGMG